MSSICGIINFDGAPVDPLALQKMAKAAAYSGPDGSRFWIDGNAGFAHLALHTTPEAVFEQQPMRDPQTGLIWIADARVDNRDELIDFFKKHGDLQENKVITDIELLMLAYRYWGDDFLPHIYGNYAFVMWNPATQKALAGRDFLGLRPMFYMRHGQTFYFASVIRSILAVLPEKPALNELLIADYYRYNFDRWIAETIYLPIRRLPASCQVAVDAHDEKIHQHWMIVNGPILRYKSDQEYYDQFLELFQTALKACARTADPLGIHLSGGIDSSSMACALHKMWHENKLGSYLPAVKMIHMRHTNNPSEEESLYHDATVKACHLFSSVVMSGENFWGFQEMGNERGGHLDEPEIFIGRSIIVARLKQSREVGCKVVVQGIGGDELYQVRIDEIDLLDDLPASLWVGAIQKYYEFMGFFRTLKLGGRLLLQKSGLQPIWSRLRSTPPPWLKTIWIKQLVTTQPHFELSIPNAFSSMLQRRRQTIMFTSGFYLQLMENSHQEAIENHIELRYPFLDRYLIEFTFRLPSEKLLDLKFVIKPFLKKALSPILPEAILQRTNKCVIDPTIYRELRGKESLKLRNILRRIQKCQIRYIDLSVYNKYWDVFLAENILPSRALLTPLMMQSWIDDTNILINL